MKKIAFVCVHNACRSQIAQALGNLYLKDKYECYSCGSVPQEHINSDAVRLIKKLYGIDMQLTQYSKTRAEIPTPDLIISMGCEVACPYMGRDFDDNWHLEDPTGKSDEFFEKVIKQIEEKIKAL